MSKNVRAAAVKAVRDYEASLNKASAPCVHRTNTTDNKLMDISIARLILAQCYAHKINNQYGNVPGEVPCSCPRCQEAAGDTATIPTACCCSGCNPEDPSEYQVTVEKVKKPRAKRGQGISKEMEDAGMKCFALLRKEVF